MSLQAWCSFIMSENTHKCYFKHKITSFAFTWQQHRVQTLFMSSPAARTCARDDDDGDDGDKWGCVAFYWTQSCSWSRRSCFCSTEHTSFLCNAGTMSLVLLCLCFCRPLNASSLLLSLFLSASSRSLSKLTLCRQQGPPPSQVRRPIVQLSSFFSFFWSGLAVLSPAI